MDGEQDRVGAAFFTGSNLSFGGATFNQKNHIDNSRISYTVGKGTQLNAGLMMLSD